MFGYTMKSMMPELMAIRLKSLDLFNGVFLSESPVAFATFVPTNQKIRLKRRMAGGSATM